MTNLSRAFTLRGIRKALLFPLAIVLLAAIPAHARSYHISRFNSTIHVHEDGSADIAEQITFVFRGQFQGIYRDIPVEYPGPRGTNYSLFVSLDKITDDSGSSLKYEKSKSNGFLKLKIYVPGAVDSTRTINIEYSVSDAAKF